MNTLSKGKLQKYKYLLKNRNLVQHLPVTYPLSKRSLSFMLKKYGKVVVKPEGGAKGVGILVITSDSGSGYEVQSKSRKWHYANESTAFATVKQLTMKRSFLIQQYIPFARMNNRLFDIRIMTQLDEAAEWKVTGRLTKVAYKGYAVTNPEEFVKPVAQVLGKSSISRFSPEDLIANLDSISLEAAKQLHTYYPNLTTIGFDLGIDQEGKIWMIEPNFSPAIYWFKQLPKRTTYNRIIYFKQIQQKKMQRKTFSPSRSEAYDEFYYYS